MRESHVRGRAREGIASLCLVLDSFTPLPTGALKNGEILQFPTATPDLFLENKANAPPAFCEDALLLPQRWQQICSHCQSEVVGALWGSSLTAFCWAVSLDVRGAICLPSCEPPSAVLDALVRPFAGRGAGGALLLQVFPCGPRSWHWCWIQAVLLPCPGCHDPASRAGLHSGFHVRGKQLGFHLSRFMNKFMRSHSSWLGLCHSLAGPRSLPPAS